jgi:ATP-binding cassette subfamily C protein
VSDDEFRKTGSSWALIKYFFKAYPWRTCLVSFFLLVSAVVEGFSIALLLPLLETAMGPGAESGSGMSIWVRKALGSVGMEASLGNLLILIVLGITLKSAIRWGAMNHAGYSVARVATDLRHSMLDALMGARWSHFVHSSSGYYTHALGVEAKIASTAYQNLTSAIACLVFLIIYVVTAIFVAWQTAALAVVTAVLLMVVLRKLIHTSRKAGRKQIMSMKVLTGRLSDALNTFKPVKAMAGEKELQKVLEKETVTINDALRMKVMAGETLTSLQEPVMMAVLAGGLYFAIQHLEIAFAPLMIQAFLFQRLVFQSSQLQRSIQAMATQEAALWSLRQGIENAQKACEPDSSGKPHATLASALSLNDVDFSYGERGILDKVSLTIPAGTFSLLVGPSGMGKTTLLDLVAGLITPQSGAVLADGVSLRDIDLSAWRRRIGYVAQEMGLLHESVFSNVTLGDTSITRAEVEHALVEAGAWDFVSEMDGGMDAMVGERGSKLSGGQRQRIALARAMARKPCLLLLDEITASLDPESEQAICQTLESLKGRVTLVAISHQTALRNMADQVLHLENGHIVAEKGSI